MTEPRGSTRAARAVVHQFLVERIGRRGAALAFFALLDLVYAYSLFFPAAETRRTSTTRFIESVAPLPLWGALWAGAGLACLVCVLRVYDRIGFAATMAVQTLWGLLFAVATVVGVERAYLSAALWLCAAGWVAIISGWPEPPRGPATGDPVEARPAGMRRP